MNNKLSKFIIEESNRQNLETKDLAEKSSLSEDYIRKIKRNEIKSISLPTLKALAKGLNMPLKTFLEDIGEIEIINDYSLNEHDSIDFIKAIVPFTNLCGIDLSILNENEMFELANNLVFAIKISYFKYKK